MGKLALESARVMVLDEKIQSMLKLKNTLPRQFCQIELFVGSVGKIPFQARSLDGQTCACIV